MAQLGILSLTSLVRPESEIGPRRDGKGSKRQQATYRLHQVGGEVLLFHIGDEGEIKLPRIDSSGHLCPLLLERKITTDYLPAWFVVH